MWIFSSLFIRVKQDRIAALQEEAAELKAMLVNVDEKVQFLTDHHHDLLNKRAALDAKLREAKAAGRETVAQHITAEVWFRRCMQTF